MVWAIFSLIIRSIFTVITASGFIHLLSAAVMTQPWQQPTKTHVNKIRSCNFSYNAPDNKRKYCSKNVAQSRNNKLSHTVVPCWSFCKNCIYSQSKGQYLRSGIRNNCYHKKRDEVLEKCNLNRTCTFLIIIIIIIIIIILSITLVDM
jgi:hypothetical protein